MTSKFDASHGANIHLLAHLLAEAAEVASEAVEVSDTGTIPVLRF